MILEASVLMSCGECNALNTSFTYSFNAVTVRQWPDAIPYHGNEKEPATLSVGWMVRYLSKDRLSSTKQAYNSQPSKLPSTRVHATWWNVVDLVVTFLLLYQLNVYNFCKKVLRVCRKNE
jgi:hypothetical protein